MRRSGVRGVAVLAISVVSLMVLLVGPTRAEVQSVSGVLAFRDNVALSPTAVAVITLTDRSPDGAGTIIGQQRIDAPVGGARGEIAFSVPFEDGQINQTHAYSIHASVVDGASEWQNKAPVPTITGGPTEGLTVQLIAPNHSNPAQVTGTIAMPANAPQLSTSAVAYAAILNADSGRVVIRQTLTTLAAAPYAFSITYDADLVDPEATYMAVGAVIDGEKLWQSPPSPIEPGATVALSVVKTSQDIPPAGSPAPSESPSVEPTEEPTGGPTEEPTTAPTEEPTSGPTDQPTEAPTEEPTAAPTEEPTEAPTEEPTAAPTEAPTAAPTEAPTASPSPSPSPSGSPSITPVPTSVSGTLLYRESVELTDQAHATVAVVQVQGGTLTVVGVQDISNPGQVPIAFDVPLDLGNFDPTLDTELWATLADGDNAWATGDGVAVATNGAPSVGVVVELTYRPDLLEGEVSGFIVGTGDELTDDGYYMTWVISAAGDVLGVDNQLAGTGEPIPWAVPFRVADVQATEIYIARAYVKDGDDVWVTQQDTPVITEGNPFADVELTVAQVAPTPSPTASPTATAAPTPPASGGIDPLVIALVAGLAIIGVIVVVMFMRRE